MSPPFLILLLVSTVRPIIGCQRKRARKEGRFSKKKGREIIKGRLLRKVIKEGRKEGRKVIKEGRKNSY